MDRSSPPLVVLHNPSELSGNPEYGTVLGKGLILAAHVALVFALVALWAAQAERSGLPGIFGMVLGVAGTTLVSGVVLVEIAGASGVEVDGVLAGGVSGVLGLLGGLAFFLGLILFGVATMRAGVFSRLAGLLLITGDVVFGAGDFFGPAAPIVFVLGAAITCAGFVWLGLAMLLGPRNSATIGQTASVG